MPETYGLPEDEPTTAEQVADRLTAAIAGQGVVRRIVVYMVLVAALALSVWFPPMLVFASVATILLIATDVSLT